MYLIYAHIMRFQFFFMEIFSRIKMFKTIKIASTFFRITYITPQIVNSIRLLRIFNGDSM